MKAGREGWMRRLGSTGLKVSAVCMGGSPLGGKAAGFQDVPFGQAVELVTAALASPIRMIDTSNGYSEGESERRIGTAVAQAGGLPPDFIVATKVDARGRDYSGARVRESVYESLERLGLDHLPLLHLHDPEFHDLRDLVSPGGAVEALASLREEGLVSHLGVAGGDTRVLTTFLDLGVFDVILVHNRWTLVDRSAAALIARANEEGLGVINAAVYGGGILAAPRRGLTSYGYRPAAPATLAAIAAMADACERHGTDLATAALQYSLRTPEVHTTVVGMSTLQRLGPLLDAVDTVLPATLWDELESLVPPSDYWLDPTS